MQVTPPTKATVPFLKWAGGKRWLADRHLDLFPHFSGKYIEPFLGSGSVFFRLRPKDALLSDANAMLIECYQQIRDNFQSVETLLQEHQERHGKEHYYSVRAAFFEEPCQRAAQFLYLNRTCWNGLYRVNKNGKFNVPIGTKTSVLLPSDDFAASALALRGVSLAHSDFERAIEKAGPGDLVYADPPYTVQHNYNGFLKYNETIFSWADQVRLRKAVEQASRRGARIVVSNAAHESLLKLYDGLGTIHIVNRASVLAASSARRGTVEEILVVV
ncbi:DNA methyltransferase [Sinorhizobium meliloti]|nr:Dam family site-specific DNA-(adenine-N6)-methyltransferase [Sinorhizobium meliloti]ASP73430.1 DNA methyltransferase [Sinorhizobium meliloti]MQW52575.1 Dam family site-specific DNA-(adenine-N6)-methyltransferase [Sinorhizobium meliloti]